MRRLAILILVCGIVSKLSSAQLSITPCRNDVSLLVVINAKELLAHNIEERLKGRCPFSLEYKVDLWKEKFLWFKDLLVRKTQSYLISYNRWKEVYQVEDEYGIITSFTNFSSLKQWLANPQINVSPLRTLDHKSNYLLIVQATLRPKPTNTGVVTRLAMKLLKSSRKTTDLLIKSADAASELAGLKDKVIVKQIKIRNPFLLKKLTKS